ncbi:MAG: acetyl-CoA C-acyltransferase [Saprospiraceae bacterium]|nr:acetyl-CoA C-acyltransferase [Saprospiraceae bacterium]
MSLNTYIIDGCRTPIGNFKGSLSGIRTDDLASIPLKMLYKKYEFLDNELDEVILGCANQAGEDNRNVARMAALLAGINYRVPAETVNRLCASGMSAVIHAHRSIITGDAEIVMAGGVENMTRGPWVISKASTPFGNDAEMFDSSFGWRFINPKMKEMYGVDAMGETAENLTDIYKITREEQDYFALSSQKKAAYAQTSGRLALEIVPVELVKPKKESIWFSDDEFIKPNSTMDGLSKLRAAFRKDGGTVTAGNASGLNDGSAALLVASESCVKRHDLKPICRIVSSAVVGVEPKIMGIGPVEASQKALRKAGLTINQMDIIEINEAFAVQVLSCLKAMNIPFDDPRINPNGGGIALGHPLGMTGTRILLSAALELQLKNKKFALVTMCIGVGQGYAVILENINL